MYISMYRPIGALFPPLFQYAIDRTISNSKCYLFKSRDGWKGDKIEGDERDAEIHIRRKRIAGVILKGHGAEIDNELSTMHACKESCCWE